MNFFTNIFHACFFLKKKPSKTSSHYLVYDDQQEQHIDSNIKMDALKLKSTLKPINSKQVVDENELVKKQLEINLALLNKTKQIRKKQIKQLKQNNIQPIKLNLEINLNDLLNNTENRNNNKTKLELIILNPNDIQNENIH